MNEIRVVCTGRGGHRVKQLDRFVSPPTPGGRWESALIPAVGVAEARRMGVVELNEFWWFRCPSCPLDKQPRPRTLDDLDRELSAAETRGDAEIDLSMPVL